MVEVFSALLHVPNNLFTTSVVIGIELKLAELILEGDNLRRILGLVVIEQNFDGLFEVGFGTGIDGLSLGLVILHLLVRREL